MSNQPTKLTDRLREILKSAETRTIEQQDADHDAWRRTNEGLVEIIRDPRLGIPPTQRSWELRREMLLESIQARKEQK